MSHHCPRSHLHWIAAAIALAGLVGCQSLPPEPVMPPSAATSAQSTAVLPRVVVLDIDGTITPHNLLIWRARPHAASVLQALASQGYRMVYVTARHNRFQVFLPHWLQRNGFPKGALHAIQPEDWTGEHDAAVLAFKSRVLQQYRNQGWRLALAFGDSSTDFAAYASAGIPVQNQFAFIRQWSNACQPGAYAACLHGWDEVPPLLRQRQLHDGTVGK